jgi:Tfp pilus assembly protein PilF
MANIILLICMTALVACSSTAKKNKEKSELYFGAGTQSLMSQDYTDALTNLIKANELDPENPEIINNLAMAYYFKGEQDLAIKSLKRSIEIKDNSDAKVNLASIYFQNGDLKTAEKIYTNVLKDLTYDKQARTYYNLGLISMKRSNTLQAENYFKKSVKEDNTYCPAYYQLGLINYSRRQYNQSLKNFKEATMGTCYDQPAAHYYQAMSLSALKRNHEAMMKFDEIDARFKETEYAELARKQIAIIQSTDSSTNTEEFHATRKMHGTPEF